jgi:hypothetical protein
VVTVDNLSSKENREDLASGLFKALLVVLYGAEQSDVVPAPMSRSGILWSGLDIGLAA